MPSPQTPTPPTATIATNALVVVADGKEDGDDAAVGAGGGPAKVAASVPGPADTTITASTAPSTTPPPIST